MPIYTYHCSACNATKEIEQKITAEPLTECPECKKQTLQRVPPKEVSIQFKGSGFYKTDYSKKETTSNEEKKDKPHGCGNCGCH